MQKQESPTEQISEQVLAKIRNLPPADFEQEFIRHLRAERRLSMIVIYFMKESYRRRVWAQNFPTFSKYCVEKLKMSDSDFYRKFSIMKTLEELPEIESKIISGEIQATTVAKVNQFLYRESKAIGTIIPVEEKREIFKQLEGLSHRQVERELAIRSPQSAIPDKSRQITEQTFIRQFTSSLELEQKIARTKELLAHVLSQPASDCELFTKVVDITLDKIDPIRREQKTSNKMKSTDAPLRNATPATRTNEVRAGKPHSSNKSFDSKSQSPSRNIPADTRRFVLMRDGYACTHINEETKQKCGSRWALELDHIRPFAQGGDHSPENLRVLCRTHNQLRALETYGRPKMARNIRSL